jgi:hypothetical protein
MLLVKNKNTQDAPETNRLNRPNGPPASLNALSLNLGSALLGNPDKPVPAQRPTRRRTG